MNRGDIVAVNIPYMDATGQKVRPAVVVQCDRLNWKIQSTVVAIITSNVKLATSEPTQFLIDPAAPEGGSSGLTVPSAVKCENVFTVRQSSISAKIGRLSPTLIQKLEASLRAAFQI